MVVYWAVSLLRLPVLLVDTDLLLLQLHSGAEGVCQYHPKHGIHWCSEAKRILSEWTCTAGQEPCHPEANACPCRVRRISCMTNTQKLAHTIRVTTYQPVSLQLLCLPCLR